MKYQPSHTNPPQQYPCFVGNVEIFLPRKLHYEKYVIILQQACEQSHDLGK
jgi:hypothetical protein